MHRWDINFDIPEMQATSERNMRYQIELRNAGQGRLEATETNIKSLNHTIKLK